MAVSVAKKFLKNLAQPFAAKDQEGVSTWSLEDLMRHKELVEDTKIAELEAEVARAARTGNGDDKEKGNGNGNDAMQLDDDEFDDLEMEQAMLDMEE